jgi:hypothetical protein
LLFVLFLVLFWAAVARLHCWLSSLKATRCGFPLKNFRHPALAHYLLVRPTSQPPLLHVVRASGSENT